MAGYNSIAVAIDLSSESEFIIQRALDAARAGCRIHLIYVQEPMAYVYMGVFPHGPVFEGMNEVEENLKADLGAKLDALGERFNISPDLRHFLTGAPAIEIHRFTDENSVELVVLETHGQKGVQLLLGSTANSVLHGSNCDVLAVRIQEGD